MPSWFEPLPWMRTAWMVFDSCRRYQSDEDAQLGSILRERNGTASKSNFDIAEHPAAPRSFPFCAEGLSQHENA